MSSVSAGSQGLPPQLQQALQDAPVVLFVSPLTDARPVRRWLERHCVAFEQIELGMANAASREQFHQLRAVTGWHGLPQIFIDGEFVGGIEEFFAHPRVAFSGDDGTPPKVRQTAQWLGYLGALPFAACAGLAVFGTGTVQATALQALLAYGAVILSFVGALHWTRGLQAAPAARGVGLLLVSVLPALLAWLALLLGPPGGAFLLAAGLLVMYLFDRRAWQGSQWFRQLRLHLTGAAVVSLATGAALAGLLV